ncbi:MAG: hypothetical protein KIT14_03980 [bacterium]|nr:hypothetical protein [bacterium]
MRLLLLLALGLALLDCGPKSQQCSDATDGGQACSSRMPTCSGIDRCGPTYESDPSENCICVEAPPCDQQDRLSCHEGGCAAGEFCGAVGTDGADFQMSAQASPFTVPPGVATAFTNLALDEVIIITAGGYTQYGNEGEAGCSGTPDVLPDGTRSVSGVPCTPAKKACSGGCAVNDAHIGEPIAKIGDGPWFAVGYGVIHKVGHNGPSEHGQLWVAYNDEGDFSGNGGEYFVHVERVTGCGCQSMGPITTGQTSAVCGGVPNSMPVTAAAFAPPPGATFALSTTTPGQSAMHTATFDTGVDQTQGYSATITYPDAFAFNGFTALGPVNTRVGTYAMDFDFDGRPDFTTWIRSTGADTAYADIDLSGSPTAADAIITRAGNVFSVVAPNGGDEDAGQSLTPPSRVTVKLLAGILVNPPGPGDFGISVTVTSVDPDTGGADDGQGTAPESFTVEQIVAVGCKTDLDCDDGRACTTDTCGGGFCSHTPISGFAGALCALDDLLADGLCGADPVDAGLDGAIDAKVGKAKNLLAAAEAQTKAKKRLAGIKKAEKQLAAAARAVKKAAKKKKITTACRDTLAAMITARKNVVKALRAS